MATSPDSTDAPTSETPPALRLPGNGFSLWLCPETWPRPRLKLPGEAHTVWLCPETWPKPKMRLPGDGFTVWLDSASWPRPKLKLPGAAFSVWLDPAAWPVAAPVIAEPVVETPAPIQIKVNRAFTVWTDSAYKIPLSPAPKPAAAAPEVLLEPAPAPAVPAEKPVPAVPALRLPGEGFTLWTHPARVQAFRMQNPAPAAPAAPVSAPAPGHTAVTTRTPLPAAPVSSLSPAPAPRVTAPTPAAAPQPVPASSGGGSGGWIALAGCLATLGLGALHVASTQADMKAAEEKAAHTEEELIKTAAAAESLTNAKVRAENALQTTSAELTAKLDKLTTATASMGTELETARAEADKNGVALRGLETAAAKASVELADARKEFAARETALRTSLNTITEEHAQLKRAAADEAVKAKEALSRLEAEKAAAVRDAAAAAAELNALKAAAPKPQ